MNLVLRKEITDNKFQPLLPSLSLEYKLFKNNDIYLKGNISKNNHLPSLNDLYWYPGGNPNLLPENGYSYEMGLKFRKLKEKLFDFESEVTFYRTKITNWILWQPDPVFRYWTPLNLKEVISSGLEVNLNYTYHFNSIIFRFNTIHTITSARNIKPINQNDNTTDRQLIYTPFYSYNAVMRIEWKKIFINSETQYIGKRYTNTTNTRYMPSYQLIDVSSGLVLNTNKKQYVLQFSVCNIFDINYQAIAWQPMPGRNYEFILKINFFR
jgi:iron complex outermembrane receptor protein